MVEHHIRMLRMSYCSAGKQQLGSVRLGYGEPKSLAMGMKTLLDQPHVLQPASLVPTSKCHKPEKWVEQR